MKRILRTSIPVDDRWHSIEVHGPVVHVATRFEAEVEIWWLDDSAIVTWQRTFRVYGTGEDDVDGAHVGSAITPSGKFVWHLFERVGGASC